MEKQKVIPAPTYFGRNLKFMRRIKSLSQTELANAVKLNRGNIASYESGIVEPNIKNLLYMCNYLEVEPVKMLEEIIADHTSEEMLSSDELSIEEQFLANQFDEFIEHTNNFTKVYEGYKTKYEQIDLQSDELTSDHYDLLEILEIMKTLIKTNWLLIQSFFPDKK